MGLSMTGMCHPGSDSTRRGIRRGAQLEAQLDAPPLPVCPPPGPGRSQKPATQPEPKITLVILCDPRGGRGVYWTLRIAHVGACSSQPAGEASARVTTSDEQLRSDVLGKDRSTLNDAGNES